jgi:hypothetical protein
MLTITIGRAIFSLPITALRGFDNMFDYFFVAFERNGG